MLEFDEVNEKIAELERVEKETRQALERKREERKRLELQIKTMNRREESNRVHKMILFGSTIWSEYTHTFPGTAEEYLTMLHDTDDRWVRFAKGFFKDWLELKKEQLRREKRKENSDSV